MKMVGGNDASRSYSAGVVLASCLCWQGNKDTQVITMYHERLGSKEKKIPGEKGIIITLVAGSPQF